MKFLKSIFKVDPGAGPMERFVTYAVPLLVAALFLWLMIASYGIGNSALARAHQAAEGTSATIFATIFYAAAGLWAWWNWSDRIPFRVNDIVATLILAALIVLAVNANTGFFVHVR